MATNEPAVTTAYEAGYARGYYQGKAGARLMSPGVPIYLTEEWPGEYQDGYFDGYSDGSAVLRPESERARTLGREATSGSARWLGPSTTNSAKPAA